MHIMKGKPKSMFQSMEEKPESMLQSMEENPESMLQSMEENPESMLQRMEENPESMLQSMEESPESMWQTIEEKPLRLKLKKMDGEWQIQHESQPINREVAAYMYCRNGNMDRFTNYNIRSDKYEDISDDELIGTERHWTEGLIGDYISECATLINSADVRWRQRSLTEDIEKLQGHRKEIEDSLQVSEDSEEERITSQDLEKVACQQAETLLRTLRRLTKRDEIRSEFTPELGQRCAADRGTPEQPQDDEF